MIDGWKSISVSLRPEGNVREWKIVNIWFVAERREIIGSPSPYPCTYTGTSHSSQSVAGELHILRLVLHPFSPKGTYFSPFRLTPCYRCSLKRIWEWRSTVTSLPSYKTCVPWNVNSCKKRNSQMQRFTNRLLW